jgi:hypothetical protein
VAISRKNAISAQWKFAGLMHPFLHGAMALPDRTIQPGRPSIQAAGSAGRLPNVAPGAMQDLRIINPVEAATSAPQ